MPDPKPRPVVGRAVPIAPHIQGSANPYNISAWPALAERNWQCECGQPLTRERLATKTVKAKNVKALIVEAERYALLCPACGVVAWEAAK